MDIQLSADDERYIRERIEAGRDRDASAVVQRALRVLRQMKQELDAELLAGLDSGDAQPLADDWKARVRRDASAKAASIERKLA